MKRIILFAVALAIYSGCVTTNSHTRVDDLLHVTIDSFSSGKGIGGSSFFIIPSPNGNIPIEDFRFLEYSSHLRNALLSLGLHDYQKNYKNADLVIILTYGVLPPQSYTSQYSRPIYETLGGGETSYSEISWTPDGPSVTSGTIHSIPQFGVVGTRTTEHTTTVYGGAVMIHAKDWKNATSNKVPALWSCQIVYCSLQALSEREALPLAINAAANYFGSQPGRTIDIDVKLETDQGSNALYRTRSP